MKSLGANVTAQLPADTQALERTALKAVAATAFVLLAVALCVRPLLGEDPGVSAMGLMARPEARVSGSLMVRHLCHVLVGVGAALSAVWIILSGRKWRPGSLEAGALVLIGGAILAVHAASDKRLSMNAALDAILPLIAAAALCQILAHRSMWRRALLAGLVAIAAANCCKATAQQCWEYRRSWDAYEKNKAQFWSQQGIRLDDPAVASFEAVKKAFRPMGFMRGGNVLSSFLLLGLSGTLAAVAACGWRRAGGRPTTPLLFQLLLVITLVLVSLAVWNLVVLSWIRTAGSLAGFLAAVGAGIAAARLYHRPDRLASLLLAGLLLLQIGIVGLALCPSRVHRAMLNYPGAGGKVRTLGARLCYWDSAIRMFLDSPLTGVGPAQFGKHYVMVRPAYSDETPSDAHNWLLNMAAEWGILGVFGVAIAAAGSGWTMLRALARPPDENVHPWTTALLPAMVIVLGCWLIAASDLPRSQWTDILLYPMAVSLVAGGAVSLCRLCGRTAQMILFAGVIGFFVHCADEISPTIPGALWPFWAMVALAMSWSGPGPAASITETSLLGRMARAVPILMAATALAALALSVQPARAVWRMYQAGQAAADHRPEQAVRLLQAAAAIDPLDPLPLTTAAFLRYELWQANGPQALSHLRDCVGLARAAVERNPLECEYRRQLGLATMCLASAVNDRALAEEAIGDMRKALELNPRWTDGWVELAQMADAAARMQGDPVAILRTALAAVDQALALEDNRPREVAPTLAPEARAGLLTTREQLAHRLEAAVLRSAATKPSH